MDNTTKTEIVKAMIRREMADYIASNGYKLDKDDLIDIIKEMAIAIEEAGETFNENMAYGMTIRGFKENL
jgi:hypothetical protein